MATALAAVPTAKYHGRMRAIPRTRPMKRWHEE